MRTTILLALSLLAATGTAASAFGLNLRWTACAGDGGEQNRAFACDTNSGSNVLAASFVLPFDLAQVNGNELVVDIATSSSVLPAWWQFRQIGTCRQAELTIAAHNGAGCPDVFLGKGSSMNIAAYQFPIQSANRARLLCVNAVPEFDVVHLLGLQEYAIARWTITNAGTVGAGSCAGCTVPACILFASANITMIGNANNTKLTTEESPGSSFVTWQGGGENCPAVVPARKSTWGAVKSLYR